MSTMTDTMQTATAVNYFDPSQEKTNTRLAQGVYPANIIKCDSHHTLEIREFFQRNHFGDESFITKICMLFFMM